MKTFLEHLNPVDYIQEAFNEVIKTKVDLVYGCGEDQWERVMFEHVDRLLEASLTPEQKQKREDIVKSMKKDKADLIKRYGDDWESVMYATATKLAMK